MRNSITLTNTKCIRKFIFEILNLFITFPHSVKTDEEEIMDALKRNHKKKAGEIKIK